MPISYMYMDIIISYMYMDIIIGMGLLGREIKNGIVFLID